MTLINYFESPLFEQALYRYAKFSQEQGWHIEGRLSMYQLAAVAFTDVTTVEASDAFCQIYDSLRGGWTIFRGVPREQCRTNEQVMTDLLTHCSSCSRKSGLTLSNVTQRIHSEMLLNCLRPLSEIKQMSEFPHMAVSKFLHFYNPRLFPIYDRKVVWNRVCTGAFKQDYDSFCSRNGYKVWESRAEFNLYYSLWASEHIRHVTSEKMTFFKEWILSQTGQRDKYADIESDLSTYFATAFEMVAIGAACLEYEHA